MIWRTQWEDENNAQEFAAAYARVLAQTHGTRRWFERRTWQITRQGRTSAVRRKERRVDVLIDVPAARWRSVVNGLR